MNFQIRPLPAGLYFVATPIGSARDITLRALDVLASADVIAAEDTRTLRKLLDIHGVPLGERPVIAYHDHNGDAARPRLMRALEEGKSVAYASEAGTPLVADPGYSLSRAALDAGYLVTSAPGPSAAVTALTIAGLPTDHFYFAGFLPNASGARRSALAACGGVPATLVFYESPKRLAASLGDMAEVLGAARQAAVCRELTKKFEEVRRGTLEDLAAHYRENAARGEVVVLVDRAGEEAMAEEDVETALRRALETLSVKDAAAMVAEAYGLKRRDVYQQALSLSR